MPRIVSLMPSATEMLCALGFTEELVARSHACDFPPAVLAVPPCTEPKIALPGIGYSLQDRLRALLQEGLSPYRVDAQLLRDLRPEIIFTRFDLPDEGITPTDIREAARQWFDAEIPICSLEMAGLSDIWQAMRVIAAELGAADEGVRVTMQLQHRMAAILSQAQDCTQRPRVACLASLGPLAIANGMLCELLELAGAKVIPTTRLRTKRTPDWDMLQEANPDILIVMLHGCGRAQAREALDALRDIEEWGKLRAVQEGEIALCDASPIFYRFGPRVAEALEVFAEIIHPAEFQFGHRGQVWEPY